MALTIDQQIKCIVLGITKEEYKKRIARIRRLTEERLDILDCLDLLENNPSKDKEERLEEEKRIQKKKKRLVKVEQMINNLERSLNYGRCKNHS